jgi:hypothetical protein
MSLLQWFDYFGLVDTCYFCMLQQVIHKMIVSDILIDLEGELIQEWLQKYGPFDAVVDGANVGLVSMHSFSFYQVSGILRISFIALYLLNPLKQNV